MEAFAGTEVLADARRVWVVAMCAWWRDARRRRCARGALSCRSARRLRVEPRPVWAVGRWQRSPRTPKDVSAASRGEASRPSAALINYCRRLAGTDLQTTVELNRGPCEPWRPRACLGRWYSRLALLQHLPACLQGVLRGLTFEVRRDRRRGARPGRKDDKPHLEAGPGGLPLGLASTDGLGGTMPMGAAKACVLGSLPSGRR